MSDIPTIGASQFAIDRHKRGTGNSYSALSWDQVCEDAMRFWHRRRPGMGEADLSRKVVVPFERGAPFYYCPPRIELKEGLPVQAQVVTRQEGEDPYVETFVAWEDAEASGWHAVHGTYVSVVCYRSNVLLENGGKRSTDCEWEIVALLVSGVWGDEPMAPLTMARNQLEKDGGTKSEYTAQQYAEAIYYHATRGVKVRDP